MNILAALLLVVCVLSETLEQIAFRAAGRTVRWHWACIGAGAALHFGVLVVWFWLLRLVPLGIAMPCMGATYATVALASRVLFHEEVDRWRWLGIGLIVAGLAVIGGRFPA